MRFYFILLSVVRANTYKEGITMKTSMKIVSLLVLFVASLFQIAIGEKMVVTYLGTDFILQGGNCLSYRPPYILIPSFIFRLS